MSSRFAIGFCSLLLLGSALAAGSEPAADPAAVVRGLVPMLESEEGVPLSFVLLSVTEEPGEKGQEKKRTEMEICFYQDEHGKVEQVLRRLVEAGKEATPEELAEAQRKMDEQGEKDEKEDEMLLPLSKEGVDKYRYTWDGEVALEGNARALKLAFQPLKKGKQFISGFLLVSPGDNRLLRFEFEPGKLPLLARALVKSLHLAIDYAEVVPGHYEPQREQTVVELRVGGTVTTLQTFTDYRRGSEAVRCREASNVPPEPPSQPQPD